MPYSNVDWIAERLIKMGQIGRNMPPSWDGAKVTIPVISPDGENKIGRILPGRGLYMDCDLKSVGITKRLPYVFEKSPVMRLAEKFKSERSAIAAAAVVAACAAFPRQLLHTWLGPSILGTITTYDSIISARAGGNATDITFSKNSITTAANNWSALFDAGGFPVAGSFTASPGAVCTSATTGALSFGIPNTSGSNNCYILTFGYNSSSAVNMAMLADLLVQVGSIAINNTAFTVSSAALTRYTTGAGVLMTFEVTTALVATNAGNIVVSYTNQAGTSGQTTASQALTISSIVGRLMPIAFGPYLNLASGDFGVRAVATVTSSSANTTTGVVALHLYYPLAFVPGLSANAYVERDSTVQIDGLVQLTAASNVVGCLTLYVNTNGASSGQLIGFVRTCQG